MVFDLEVINSDATLNNFFSIGAAQFRPGTPVTINMRIIQSERDLRHVLSAAATLSMTFKTSDPNTNITATPTFIDAGDRSLITVTLTGTDTQNLIGQALILDIVDGPLECVAIKQQGLKANRTGDC